MTITYQANRMADAAAQLQAHADKAIRLIDEIVERETKAREAQLAVLDAMLAAIDAILKPKGETK